MKKLQFTDITSCCCGGRENWNWKYKCHSFLYPIKILIHDHLFKYVCVLYLLYYIINVHIQETAWPSLSHFNHERIRVSIYQLADVTFFHIRLLSRKNCRLIMRVMRWFLVSFGFTLSLIGWFLINSGFGFYKKNF